MKNFSHEVDGTKYAFASGENFPVKIYRIAQKNYGDAEEACRNGVFGFEPVSETDGIVSGEACAKALGTQRGSRRGKIAAHLFAHNPGVHTIADLVRVAKTVDASANEKTVRTDVNAHIAPRTCEIDGLAGYLVSHVSKDDTVLVMEAPTALGKAARKAFTVAGAAPARKASKVPAKALEAPASDTADAA
jgi:hypothetical protein